MNEGYSREQRGGEVVELDEVGGRELEHEQKPRREHELRHFCAGIF